MLRSEPTTACRPRQSATVGRARHTDGFGRAPKLPWAIFGMGVASVLMEQTSCEERPHGKSKWTSEVALGRSSHGPDPTRLARGPSVDADQCDRRAVRRHGRPDECSVHNRTWRRDLCGDLPHPDVRGWTGDAVAAVLTQSVGWPRPRMKCARSSRPRRVDLSAKSAKQPAWPRRALSPA